ncbi:MAG: acyl-CoA thioesterase [Solitalea-like symbiont of Acarus siro]
MKSKTPKESVSVMSQLVMPPITNYYNNLMGGDLLRMMDVVASIVAKRHSEQGVVTVSVDGVSFKNPVPLGSILTIEGKITRAFRTSMETS